MAPNTRAASAASREFLQPKVDRIDDLAEAARAINAAVQARAAANRNITECQQGVRPPSARGNRGRGWTEDELDQLGWASERGPQSQRRRGPTASGRPAQSPAAAAPESGSAAAGATATAASAEPVERGPRPDSGAPSGAHPNGPGRDETRAHEAAPVGACARPYPASVQHRLGSCRPGSVGGPDRPGPRGEGMTRGAVDALGSVRVICLSNRSRSTRRSSVGWTGVRAADAGAHATPPIGGHRQTSSAHRPGAMVGPARRHPTHPDSQSLVAGIIRNALAVQAHGDAPARAYAVELAAVLGPLMADMPTPLPDEHTRQVALLPLPEPLAVGA